MGGGRASRVGGVEVKVGGGTVGGGTVFLLEIRILLYEPKITRKLFRSCLVLLDFFTSFQILCPWL